eukprot:COSAG04_NODE_24448_length_322_cov_0.390135_1_plen_77_part_10
MRLLTGGGGGEGGEGGAGKSQSWRRASVVAVGAKVSADAVRRCPKQSPKLLSVFFNDTATTEIYTALNTLSLHDALP